MGIELDVLQNEANEGVISTPSSQVAVRIMHTVEEQMIACSVCDVLGLG